MKFSYTFFEMHFFQLTIMLTSQKKTDAIFLLTCWGFWGVVKIFSPFLPDFIVWPKMSQTIITFFMITQKVIEILAYSLWHMKAKVLGFKVQQTRYCYHSF